jgi:hypothetical protein
VCGTVSRIVSREFEPKTALVQSIRDGGGSIVPIFAPGTLCAAGITWHLRISNPAEYGPIRTSVVRIGTINNRFQGFRMMSWTETPSEKQSGFSPR